MYVDAADVLLMILLRLLLLASTDRNAISPSFDTSSISVSLPTAFQLILYDLYRIHFYSMTYRRH